jgi:arabinose-5-phosphate isomerase
MLAASSSRVTSKAESIGGGILETGGQRRGRRYTELMPEPIVATPLEAERLIARAREVLRIEADAVEALIGRVGADFAHACHLILGCRGRVVVSGMGKSGHVARKLAATLASTGTPAFFVHPAEASHGDLGMVTRDDVFIALSNSGRTDELLAILTPVKRQGAKLIAITGDPDSPLARQSDAHLDARVDKEACPLNLAPTASTTAALALGDALAVALLDARGFGPDDFARSHPGGSLGRKLLTHVADVMRTGDAVPTVPLGSSLTAAILEVTRKRMGMTTVVTPQGRLAGVFTDGDLRRLLERTTDLRSLSVDDVMTREAATIGPQDLAVEAVRRMEERRINQLPVVDAHAQVVGALHLHDLLLARVI